MPQWHCPGRLDCLLRCSLTRDLSSLKYLRKGVPTYTLILQQSLDVICDYFGGRPVNSICVATTALPRPPRADPPPCVYVLDQRPVLQGFAWAIAAAGRVATQPLVDRYVGLCPPGNIVSITGAAVEHTGTGAHFVLGSGQVLRVAYVEDLLGRKIIPVLTVGRVLDRDL